MKVYSVQGGWEYEGSSDSSLRVFSSREKAEAYAATLRGYDSVLVQELTLDAE